MYHEKLRVRRSWMGFVYVTDMHRDALIVANGLRTHFVNVHSSAFSSTLRSLCFNSILIVRFFSLNE